MSRTIKGSIFLSPRGQNAPIERQGINDRLLIVGELPDHVQLQRAARRQVLRGRGVLQSKHVLHARQGQRGLTFVAEPSGSSCLDDLVRRAGRQRPMQILLLEYVPIERFAGSLATDVVAQQQSQLHLITDIWQLAVGPAVQNGSLEGNGRCPLPDGGAMGDGQTRIAGAELCFPLDRGDGWAIGEDFSASAADSTSETHIHAPPRFRPRLSLA